MHVKGKGERSELHSPICMLRAKASRASEARKVTPIPKAFNNLKTGEITDPHHLINAFLA